MDRMRASDTEREAAVGVLRTAAHEGRLDTDELEERVARAYAAKTRGELMALLADLPNAQPPAPRPSMAPPAPAPYVPGLLARWNAPVPLDQATADVMAFVAPPLRSYGYSIVSSSRTQITFARTHRPTWTVIVAVLLFPLGLLALLHTENETITLSATDHGDRTTIVAAGSAPPGLRHALSQLAR